MILIIIEKMLIFIERIRNHKVDIIADWYQLSVHNYQFIRISVKPLISTSLRCGYICVCIRLHKMFVFCEHVCVCVCLRVVFSISLYIIIIINLIFITYYTYFFSYSICRCLLCFMILVLYIYI